MMKIVCMLISIIMVICRQTKKTKLKVFTLKLSFNLIHTDFFLLRKKRCSWTYLKTSSFFQELHLRIFLESILRNDSSFLRRFEWMVWMVTCTAGVLMYGRDLAASVSCMKLTVNWRENDWKQSNMFPPLYTARSIGNSRTSWESSNMLYSQLFNKIKSFKKALHGFWVSVVVVTTS